MFLVFRLCSLNILDEILANNNSQIQDGEQHKKAKIRYGGICQFTKDSSCAGNESHLGLGSFAL